MSSRRVLEQGDLPRAFTIETYADGTAWIVWADGRRRQRLCDYAALNDRRCRGKGDGRGDECGTLPGDPCRGQGNAMCLGAPGPGDDRDFQSMERTAVTVTVIGPARCRSCGMPVEGLP